MLGWGVAFTFCRPHPLCVLLFAMAAFICLLVHECGHAVAGSMIIKREVGVLLTWLGGTCCSDEEPKCSVRQGVGITLAGPLVGLLVALGVFCVLLGCAQSLPAAAEMALQMLSGQIPAELLERCPGLLLALGIYILQISVCWNVLNLLPIYPLDGGMIMHELMDNTHLAHSISLVCTCLLALLFIAVGVWALAVLMLALSYYNYKCILVHSE